MKLEHIIISHLYLPGSAATNRIIAYAQGFSQAGMTVSLILGSSECFRPPLINHIGIETVSIVQKHGFKLQKKLAREIKLRYGPDDTAVLIYGSPALCWFLPKQKYNIFYECTEVPFYGRKKTVVSGIKESIKTFLAQRATGMLVISNALSEYFKQKGIDNIFISNMFVDVGRFENISMTADRDNYIAYCGTISPFKDGVDILIKAFALFVVNHEDYGLRLIGRFESIDAENTITDLIKEMGLTEKVTCTGQISPDEMPQILSDAKILALARPDNEQAKYGFPTKLGEYLATGKPVVVTDVGEIGAFLHDGVNCKMAKPDNPEDFSNCLSWVVDNYDEALIYGKKGKELTKNEFSSNVQSIKVLGFMEKCINKNNNYLKNGI